MLKNLKYFLKHSAIYSISNIVSKGIGIILLPIYSSFITVAEFGVLGILEITISIIFEVLNLGLGTALVMLNNYEGYKHKKEAAFFTIFFSSLFVCSIFLIVGKLSLPGIVSYFGNPAEFGRLFNLSIYIIVLRVLNNLLSNKLRAEEKSISYTVVNLIKIFLSLGFTIYFVAFRKIGIIGVLYSYVISESTILIIMIPYMIKNMQLRYDTGLLKTAIKFGVPLIFSTLAMMVLNVSDRYILKFFANYRTLGLYDLGYRVAGVINMFFIIPLNLTLIPIAYKMYNKEGDKRYFSKMLTYLTFLLVWTGLALSLFSKEIIRTFALNPDYWPAYQVVPVVVFSYVFFGMRLVSMLGLYLTKNTKYVAYTTLIAAIVNIVLNFIFIPMWGMMAAAFTTLVSFIVLYILSDKISGRYYKIPFEYAKIIKVIFIGLLFYLISLSVNVSFIFDILLKFVLIILLPFSLYLIGFYESIELERINGIYVKWRNPLKWGKNIKNYF